MTDLLAARSQMAMSLGFHIVFAVVGMAMPLLMCIAEWRHLRRTDPADRTHLELARRWSKGTAILFAVGAVSGTVLSFELGLLWPHFMEHAGPIIGMPFSLEGIAFFLEAIFLGIYLYGWNRVPPRVHLAAGACVLICGTLSGILVVCANAWMNTPAGFRLERGHAVDIDPIRAMLNPAALSEGLHMVLAAFAAVGFAVAGIHAWALWRAGRSGRPAGGLHALHGPALRIALLVGGVAAVLQPLSGDYAAKVVARTQPIKLAAMEGQWETRRGAPLRIGGWPDEKTETTRYALELPKLLSVLAFADPDAEVAGLQTVPPGARPPVAIVHVAFQIMVACGLAMLAVAALAVLLKVRKRRIEETRWFLLLVIAAAPLGLVAIEAGWVVTEVGRQPWIVQGIQRTAQAVTNVPNLIVPFMSFTVLYLILSGSVLVLLRKHVFATVEPQAAGAAADGRGAP